MLMLKRILHNRIAQFERRYDYDMQYAHEILDVDRSEFQRFARAARLVNAHAGVPPAALFAARIAATMSEDCGPCTQLVVRMAEEAKIPDSILRAIVAGEEGSMNDDARLGWRFTHATLAHDASADALREEIVRLWGRQAIVSLALTIAGARIFPTIKYALGHGKTCQRVRVGAAEVPTAAKISRQPATA
jgi:hypothetical protein